MGGTNFSKFSEEKDAASAYKKLVDAATYQYGHDPYNGTISTTNRFEIRNSGKAMTWEEATAFASGDELFAEKWGAAFCVRVIDEETKRDGWLFYGLAAE